MSEAANGRCLEAQLHDSTEREGRHWNEFQKELEKVLLWK
jgi:hypothetical protein